IRDPNIKVAPSFMGIAPRQNHLQGLQDDHWPRTFQATRKFQIVEFTRYSSGSVRQDPMSKRIFDDAEFGLVGDADASARRTWVRYQVLAAACSLAVITYIHRVGFATASAEFKTSLGMSDDHLGSLMAAFMVSYGLFEIPWGFLGDRLGVRTILAAV